MKLLHLGIFNSSEGQPSLRNALREISTEYEEHNWHSVKGLNEFLKERAPHFDVIFMQIQTPEIVRADTLAYIKQNSSALIFNFTGDVRQPLPKWYIDLAPYCITLFTNKTDVEYLQSLGHKAEYFQIGYNTEYYNTTGRIVNDAEIVFFGNNYGDMFPLSQLRRDMVSTLKQRYGDKFKVYGTGWGDGVRNLNTNQEEEGAIYRGCKIAINLSHFNLKNYSSDRLFRILGCGAFCLSHRFENIEEEFEEVVWWETIGDLCEHIDNVFENDQTRKYLSEMANAKCESTYTWPHRMKQLLEIIEKENK